MGEPATYESESRGTKFVIDSQIRALGYFRTPIMKRAVKEGFDEWDLVIAYHGRKTREGVIIIRFMDQDYGDPGDDYFKTHIVVHKLNVPSKTSERVTKLIQDCVKDTQVREKEGLEALGF